MMRVDLEGDIHVLPFPNPHQFIECIHKVSVGLLETTDLDLQGCSLVRALLQEGIESWRSDQFEVPQTFIKGFHVSLLGSLVQAAIRTCHHSAQLVLLYADTLGSPLWGSV